MEKRARLRATYLIVDSRERAVLPFLDTALQEHAFVQKQVTTGDYLICRAGAENAPPAVLACIERKTHKDFAASFKDGRYDNVNKMLALRAKTGCQLFFFLEGAAFPSPTRRFARIPFACILAAATKLMIRDGVFIVQTENECHTAARLADFLRTYDAVAPCGATPATPSHEALGSPFQGATPPHEALGPPFQGDLGAPCRSPHWVVPEERPEDPHQTRPMVGPKASARDAQDEGSPPGADPAPAPELELIVPDLLTARPVETDGDAVALVWARLRGVSVVLGKILAREFSVVELVAGQVPECRLRTLKAATGRAVNKDAVSSLLAVRAGSRPHAVKLVSGLRSITPAVAARILDAAGGLAGLCSWGVGDIAQVALPQKNRTVRLGTVRSERIWRLLRHRDGGGSGPPSSSRLEPKALPERGSLGRSVGSTQTSVGQAQSPLRSPIRGPKPPPRAGLEPPLSVGPGLEPTTDPPADAAGAALLTDEAGAALLTDEAGAALLTDEALIELFEECGQPWVA